MPQPDPVVPIESPWYIQRGAEIAFGSLITLITWVYSRVTSYRRRLEAVEDAIRMHEAESRIRGEELLRRLDQMEERLNFQWRGRGLP